VSICVSLSRSSAKRAGMVVLQDVFHKTIVHLIAKGLVVQVDAKKMRTDALCARRSVPVFRNSVRRIRSARHKGTPVVMSSHAVQNIHGKMVGNALFLVLIGPGAVTSVASLLKRDAPARVLRVMEHALMAHPHSSVQGSKVDP